MGRALVASVGRLRRVIVVDPLRQWDHGLGPKMGPSCHMCSTLHGEEGTAELVAFAVKIGMRRSWLQHPGDEYEHFDLFGDRRARAVRAGAVDVTARQIADVWATKRGRLQVVYATRAQVDACKAYALARDWPVTSPSDVLTFQQMAADQADLARRIYAGDRAALRLAVRVGQHQRPRRPTGSGWRASGS